MHSPYRRYGLLLGGLLIVAGAAWLLFYHECASGGAMGGWYKECDCRGVERLDFDRTEADGPLRSVCLGRVDSRRCYAFRGGPEVDCKAIAD